MIVKEYDDYNVLIYTSEEIDILRQKEKELITNIKKQKKKYHDKVFLLLLTSLILIIFSSIFILCYKGWFQLMGVFTGLYTIIIYIWKCYIFEERIENGKKELNIFYKKTHLKDIISNNWENIDFLNFNIVNKKLTYADENHIVHSLIFKDSQIVEKTDIDKITINLLTKEVEIPYSER